MSYTLVLGAGMQGTAAAYDLLKHGGAAPLVLADQDRARLEAAGERLFRLLGQVPLELLPLDAGDPAALRAALRPARVCLSALPYRFALEVTQAALETGTDLLDLGGNTDLARRQLALQRAYPQGDQRVILPDCGLMPGMGNLFVAYALAELGDLARCELRCGGLPQHPKPPLDYMLVFSVEGLLNEYFGAADVLRDGRPERVPTFSGLEHLEVEGLGRLEAFITSGGLSTTPDSFAGRILELDYKTARYPGHHQKFKLLLDLGLLGEQPIELGRDSANGPSQVVPRRLLEALLGRILEFPGEHDLAFLRVTAVSRDRTRGLCFEVLDRHDEHTGFSAMERTTGFSAAACAALVIAGEVEPGVRPLELAVNPRRFVEALELRGIRVRIQALTPSAP